MYDYGMKLDAKKKNGSVDYRQEWLLLRANSLIWCGLVIVCCNLVSSFSIHQQGMQYHL